MTTFDWDHLKQRAKAGGSVPEDFYTITLTKAEAFESAKGNVGLKLRFSVAEGPYDGAMVFHTMTVLPDYPGLMARFFEDLDALGIPETALYGNADMDSLADILTDSLPTVQAKVKVDEYNGRKSNKVADGLTHAGTTTGFRIAPPMDTVMASAAVAAPADLPF